MSPSRPGVLMQFGTDRLVSWRSDMPQNPQKWLKPRNPPKSSKLLFLPTPGSNDQRPRSMVQMLHHHHHQRPSICVMDFPTHRSMLLNFGLSRISVFIHLYDRTSTSIGSNWDPSFLFGRRSISSDTIPRLKQIILEG